MSRKAKGSKNRTPNGGGCVKRSAFPSAEAIFENEAFEHHVTMSEARQTKGQAFDLVQCILSDIKDNHQSARRSRKRTWFYKFVSGGDVSTVERVLDALSEPAYVNIRRWILNAPKGPRPFGGQPESVSYRRRLAKAGKMSILIVFVVLNLLATPFFYIMHIICVKLMATDLGRLCRHDMQLPMAFAATSENEEMIELFKKHGVDVRDVDATGNNIFHYLTGLSATDADKAISLMRLIRNIYDDQFVLARDVLMNQPNDEGMTAFEAMIGYGSPRLLLEVVNMEGILMKTVMSIHEHGTWLSIEDTDIARCMKGDVPDTYIRYGDKSLDSDSNCSRNDAADSRRRAVPKYEVRRYDVTAYEAGDIMGKQGFLLNILASRDIESMSAGDVDALMNGQLFFRWAHNKIQMTSRTVLLSNFIQILFTVCYIIFLLLTDGDQNFQPLQAEVIQNIQRQLKMSNASLDMDLVMLGQTMFGCQENYTTIDGVTMNSCEFEAFSEVVSSCPRSLSTGDLLVSCGFRRPDVNQWVIISLLHSLLVLPVVYLTMDAIFRTFFLVQNFSCSRTVNIRTSIRRIFSVRMLGSYLDKILNVIGNCIFISYWLMVRELVVHRHGRYGVQTFMTIQTAISYMIIFLMLQRFLITIWAVRLLPNIGHFVISVYSMAKNLVEFCCVYAFVLVAFGLIFSFVMRDPLCLSVRLPQFGSFYRSAFQIFNLMLGQGDFSFHDNNIAMLSYLIYCILTILLLMNLIIAVMSRTADTVMSRPWKDALHHMEKLKEALAAETMLLLFTYPFRQRILYSLMESHGFIVDRTTSSRNGKKQVKVYIEVEEHYV